MPLPDPITIDDPLITIDGVDYLCAATAVMLVAEDDEVDISTFCNPKGDRPGSTDWTCTIPLRLTYNNGTDDGTWEILHAIRKTRVTVVVAPGSGVASTTNPHATFDAYIPTIPFINGEVAASEAQSFELVLSPIGDPVFDVGAP